MDSQETKHVVEAALLAAGRPLSLDKLLELVSTQGAEADRAAVRAALDDLAADYEGRGIQLKEVASGFRVQIKSSMREMLEPLWEERAPRYTRALLETLALVAYRQPITRGEIEEVRGVAVSSNIIRTLMERGWVRVVGYRDVPGKPSMLGTTREFLDYFGLKKLDELPPLAAVEDGYPELSPQTDFLESLGFSERGEEAVAVDFGEGAEAVAEASLAQPTAAADDGTPLDDASHAPFEVDSPGASEQENGERPQSTADAEQLPSADVAPTGSGAAEPAADGAPADAAPDDTDLDLGEESESVESLRSESH
jgi:segregation and condensation protein B